MYNVQSLFACFRASHVCHVHFILLLHVSEAFMPRVKYQLLGRGDQKKMKKHMLLMPMCTVVTKRYIHTRKYLYYMHAYTLYTHMLSRYIHIHVCVTERYTENCTCDKMADLTAVSK